jgi:hypothetical protein
LYLEGVCGFGGTGDDASEVFDSGSREGNGVRNENALLEGEAKMIGSGEAGGDSVTVLQGFSL